MPTSLPRGCTSRYPRAQFRAQPIHLYQLAADKHPNPRVRLALAICAESRRLSRKVRSPPLTLPDLLVGAADPSGDN